MKPIHTALALLCLLANIRCSDFSESSPDSEIIDRISSQNLGESFAVQVQPTTKPERYMVYFAWPRIEEQSRIRIRKEQILAIVQPIQTTFSDEVDHDQTITYTFDVLDSASKVTKTFSKIVKIPTDFVVREGKSELFENQKISVNRLFVNQDVALRTNGFNTEIVTQEIVSENGVIESFAPGATAPLGQNGADAGEVTIRAKSARGTLKIIMRGQNGGEGFVGANYPGRGAPGQPPGQGNKVCMCKDCRDADNKYEKDSGTYGLRFCSCEPHGDDGTNGSQGAKGYPGGMGLQGGSTGTLKVEIVDGSAFFLQTEKQIGVGGQGGLGGTGQLGGVAPGASGSCVGRAGQEGPPGPRGDRGPKGDDGKPGLTCVYISTEAKNDCY